MSEKIKLKGQLKLPVVGKNPTFAQMKFVKVSLSEPDILPDSGSIFTCDEQGNYDFEIYTGAHLLSYNVGNAWSKPIEIIAEPLAEGLESIEISDLIGFQEIPELDATIAALNQQKQELLAIQQDVAAKQEDAAASAKAAEDSATQVDTALRSTHEFFVSKTGSDITGDGSIATPFSTIAHAVSVTKDGDAVQITLQGSTSSDMHVIDKTIALSSRYAVLICQTYTGEHIDLADSITDAFSVAKGGGLMISRSAGREVHFYARTDKTLLKSSGQSNLAVLSTHIHIADSATFYLFSESIRTQGSVVATYNTKAEKIDSALPATGSLVAVNTSIHATDSCLVFLKHTLFSGGANYLDCQTPSAISQLSNGFKVINI